MAAPRASLIPSLALLLESVLCSNGPTNTRTKKHKHKSYTGYLLNISSGSQEKSTHVNKQTNNTRKRSLRQTKPHTVSLFATHTVCVHTLLLPNMLVRSLFCAGWSQRAQRAFLGETFLRESVQFCHPQEGSPRHADPTGDSGLFSGSLSTVSHCVVLNCRPGRLWFYTTHISAAHQKTSGSAMLQTSVECFCWRMHWF